MFVARAGKLGEYYCFLSAYDHDNPKAVQGHRTKMPYGNLQHGGAAPSHSSGFRMRACCVQAFRQRPRKDRRLHRYGDLHRLSVASSLGGLQLFWL